MTNAILSHILIKDAVAAALREDLGDAGDLTTNACIPDDSEISAEIVARKPGVVAGLEVAQATFDLMDPNIKTIIRNGDGTAVQPGDCLIKISGRARSVLTAERVALNFLGRLSGIATATNALVAAVANTNAKIACTRKTTPGLRAFEKYAVKCGGGINHRFGLYDAVMIKDNHIAAAGSIAGALQAVKENVGHTVKIEIEVDTLDQLKTVLDHKADIVLLDNMSTETLKKAVAMANGKIILEASGNITIDTVKAVAETGVDVISSGSITHSAPTLDVGLDFK